MLYALLNTTFAVNSFEIRFFPDFSFHSSNKVKILKNSDDKTNGGWFTVFQNNCQHLLKSASTRIKGNALSQNI